MKKLFVLSFLPMLLVFCMGCKETCYTCEGLYYAYELCEDDYGSESALLNAVSYYQYSGYYCREK